MKYTDPNWIDRRIAACTRDLDCSILTNRPLEDLRAEAASHHLLLKPHADYDLFSDGVLIAYLRHEHTYYEWNLWEARRRQGAVEVEEVSYWCRQIIKSRTVEAIKQRFPELAGGVK